MAGYESENPMGSHRRLTQQLLDTDDLMNKDDSSLLDITQLTISIGKPDDQADQGISRLDREIDGRAVQERMDRC
ncbi:hypothetical protein E4U21_002022 [Claviceps maximensis]|nr:hypothetical protein E4U21_002022 [Claviceps maximensis]